jgi:hypothetical protein
MLLVLAYLNEKRLSNLFYVFILQQQDTILYSLILTTGVIIPSTTNNIHKL